MSEKTKETMKRWEEKDADRQEKEYDERARSLSRESMQIFETECR